MVKPFAVELYEEYLSGKTAEQLALETGIPVERIQARLRAAAAFQKPTPAAAEPRI
jgi:hypothetical protein